MPIKIKDSMPAQSVLENENIFVMTEYRAMHQDIRPLKVLILNLMPTKIITETQLLRKLSNSPLQVDVDFLQTVSYVPQHVDVKKTQYPLTKIQCERCFKLIAELCKKYSIVLSKDSVLTHYEFGLKYPQSSSGGKIDIIWLPPYPEVKPADIGDFNRNKALWYFPRV